MHPHWEFVLEREFSGHGEESFVGGKLEGYLGKNIPGGGNSRAEQAAGGAQG